MNRKIRFRKQRIYKLKIILTVVLFISVLFCGLLAVDLNKSYMFYGEPQIELFQIETMGDDNYNLSILNSKFNLNLKYIKRDINSIKTFLNN